MDPEEAMEYLQTKLSILYNKNDAIEVKEVS